MLFLFLRELLINWCKSSDLLARSLPPHVWREHSCTEKPACERPLGNPHPPLSSPSLSGCLLPELPGCALLENLLQAEGRRAVLTLLPSTTEKEKPSLQERAEAGMLPRAANHGDRPAHTWLSLVNEAPRTLCGAAHMHQTMIQSGCCGPGLQDALCSVSATVQSRGGGGGGEGGTQDECSRGELTHVVGTG